MKQEDTISTAIDYEAHKAIEDHTNQYLAKGGTIDVYQESGLYSCTISVDYPDGIVDNVKLARSHDKLERFMTKKAKGLTRLFKNFNEKDWGEL